MFTQNHHIQLQSQPDKYVLRRTEWEEIERYDGPLLPEESNAFGGVVSRLVRGLERLTHSGNAFRSRKQSSLHGSLVSRETIKTVR